MIAQHRFGVRPGKVAGLLGLADDAMAADHQHLHGRQRTEAAAEHPARMVGVVY